MKDMFDALITEASFDEDPVFKGDNASAMREIISLFTGDTYDIMPCLLKYDILDLWNFTMLLEYSDHLGTTDFDEVLAAIEAEILSYFLFKRILSSVPSNKSDIHLL